MARKPVAISNWKMAMTITDSLAWLSDFRHAASELPELVDVVVCPPFTALWAVGSQLRSSGIQLAAQNVAPGADPERTGEISAALLADVGCERVLLGHWEVRRHLGDDDDAVNRKVHAALDAGLAPILLVGEARGERGSLHDALAPRLQRILASCRDKDVETMILIYEPEVAIGAEAPLAPEQAAAGCGFLRSWLGEQYGDRTASTVRVIYGGSVTPKFASGLLASPEVDGLGATRRGRDPFAFAEIVRQIAHVKLAWSG